MIKSLLGDDDPASDAKTSTSVHSPANNSVLSLFDAPDHTPTEGSGTSQSPPESVAETIRQSGLAYSAGIAFFAAVVFMLVLGWGADVLLGTSPWGIVGGIILGSVIGFIQFFRLTSQIFKK